MSMRLLVPLAAAGLLLTGCGSQTASPGATGAEPGDPVPSPTAVPTADGPVQTTYAVTVLDDGGGPELCVGGVAESLPPQCGGPPITNWEWADHEGDFEEAVGTRWGSFHVVGTFDGERLTATEVTPAAEYEPPEEPEDADLTTPCDEPDGRWQVVDPDLTTEATLNETMRRAGRLDGYAGSWLDQSINPAYADGIQPEDELLMNDPRLLVVNVRVTGDPASAESLLRETWGGALCVSTATHTESELRRIQGELGDLPGFTSSSVGDDAVDLGVIYDDGSIQAWLAQEYGEGLVRVHSSLVPVAG